MSAKQVQTSPWPLVRLGSFLGESKQIVGDAWQDTLLLSLTLKGVIPRDMENRVGKLPESFSTYQKVNRGDLIFCLFDVEETPRTVGLVHEDGMVTSAYTVMRSAPSCDPRFLAYAYLRFDQDKSLKHLYAGLRNTIRRQDFKNIRIPLPDLTTQKLVADYLDRETAEIDAALAEHKHLRALLLERRAETITAATRPSNPELKEAPLVRLRHVTSLNPSPRVNISPDSAQLFPLFNMDSISEFGPLRPPVLRPYSELATGYSYLEPTDVAYAKVTPCFENGKGLVGAELDGPSFATTELTVLRPAPEVDQNYLALVLQSADFHAVGEASMTGAGGLKRVSEHAARNYRFLLPDKKTQIRIVEQVRLEADETDVLISDSNRLSDLLLERRAALISAAVTGQIDVATYGRSTAEQLQDESEVHL